MNENSTNQNQVINSENVFSKNSSTFLTFSRWAKFSAIFNFIGAGFLILVALFYLFLGIFNSLSFIIGFIYMIVAGFQIYLTKLIWDSATSAKKITESTSNDEVKQNVLDAFQKLGLHYKIIVILTIIYIIFITIMIIFGLLFLGTVISTLGSQFSDFAPIVDPSSISKLSEL